MLSAVFQWAPEPLEPRAADLTRGSLEIFLGDLLIWGDKEFEWTWIELLEWLGQSWLPLSVDDGLPFSVEPGHANELIAFASASVRDSSGSLAADREMQLWTFRETHDLSRSLPGTLSPPLIFWREGLIGHLLTEQEHWRFADWRAIRTFLSSLGDNVARRIHGDDQRGRVAIETWNARERASQSEIVRQATGLLEGPLPAALRNWRPRVDVGLMESVAENEVLAAARMTADLPSETVSAVLSEIRDARSGNFLQIDRLIGLISVPTDQLDLYKPHEQGHWVAQLTRRALGLAPQDKFDTLGQAAELGIEYREVSLGVAGIDAVAAWGGQHGPVVIINLDGRHSNSRVGRNASVAHEIGHLLLDRRAALPAAEVLGGQGNPLIEKRARAFAAELLLPHAVARAAFDEARTRDEVLAIVKKLSRRYVVSYEIVAWQARNSDRPLHESVRPILATLVSSPWQY